MPEPISQICGFFCHQYAWRSPQFEGSAFPLCYRCTGLFFGFLSAYVHLVLTGGLKRKLPNLRCGLTASGLTVPFLLDVWIKPLGLWDSPGWVRAATGLGVGVVLPLLLVPLSRREELANAAPLPPTVSAVAELSRPVVAGALMLWLVIHPGDGRMFQGLAVIATLGPVLFLISSGGALWQICAGSLPAASTRSPRTGKAPVAIAKGDAR